jgi:peptide/nickel transport system permease protein
VAHRLEGPSAAHLLGTDALGRDVASRIVFGTRIAVRASFQSVGLAMAVGVTLGLLVGFLGGWWDRLAMRGADIMQSIPALIFAFAVIAILGRGLTQASIAVALVFAITFMRITRGLTLREREQLYVDAARVASLRTPRIIFREILPNIVGPIVVEAAILLGSAILIIAMLSFLGLGVDAETADWGTMLDEARTYQSLQPFLAVPPGLAITFAVLLFNFTGDGLRDALTGKRSYRRPRRVAHTMSSAPRLSAARPADPETPAAVPDDVVLRLDDLRVAFPNDSGAATEVVSGVTFSLRRGETLGLVGESGSGKSMTALAMLGLVPDPGFVASGKCRFAGRDLLALPEDRLSQVRGSEIAMIFQDPIASFSPVHTIGRQLVEPLRVHRGMSEREATEKVVELLELVGVPDARRRMRDYPHQFSGGMAQRAMIAMALSCDPKVLIADEPTTALDVTIQAQVLDLLHDLGTQFEMSVLLITHDLGVIGEACDRVLVMYAGQIVEEAKTNDLFAHPRHPYAHALLAATPRNEARKGALPTVPGRVPPPWDWPQGCRFHPRCPYARERCREGQIALVSGVRCVRAGELTLEVEP